MAILLSPRFLPPRTNHQDKQDTKQYLSINLVSTKISTIALVWKNNTTGRSNPMVHTQKVSTDMNSGISHGRASKTVAWVHIYLHYVLEC
jgi:hypothetical protein